MGAPLAQLRTTEPRPNQIHPIDRPQTKSPTQIMQGFSRTSPFLPASFIASSHISHGLAPPRYPTSFYPFPWSAQPSCLLVTFPRALVPVLLLLLPETPPDPCSPCPTSSPAWFVLLLSAPPCAQAFSKHIMISSTWFTSLCYSLTIACLLPRLLNWTLNLEDNGHSCL